MAANVNNYVSAGNAAVRKAVIARKALADNKPRYDEMAIEAVTQEAKNRANAAENNARAAMTRMNSEGLMARTNIKIDRDKSIASSKRKERMTGLLAGGAALAGIGAMQMNKEEEPNELTAKYKQMLDAKTQQINALTSKINSGEAAYSNMPKGDSKYEAPDGGDAPTKPSNASSNSSTTSNTSSNSSGGGSASSFKGVYDMAVQAGAKFPELVAAQWALESAYGKTPSGKNNYFGIKASGGESSTSKPTWEVINGQEVNTSANFKDFDTPQGSVDELVSRWHKDYKGYSGVNRAGSASEAAGLLLEENYATDPAYATKLKDIMRRHGY